LVNQINIVGQWSITLEIVAKRDGPLPNNIYLVYQQLILGNYWFRVELLVINYWFNGICWF